MRAYRRLAAAAGLLLLVLCLPSCARRGQEAPGRPLVAVSILPERTFVEAVAGDLVDVVCMVGPGASPESYEPSPRETASLERAALYLAIGIPAERRILEGLSPSTRLARLDEAVDEAAPPLRLGGVRDPHFWLSPSRAEVAVGAIAHELGRLDPGHIEVYQANAQAYAAEIRRAAKQCRAILKGREGATFLVHHPAYGYFADEFGLRMEALEEDGKPAGPRHMARMARLAREKGLDVVFYEREDARRRAQAFAETIGGRAVRLDPLAADYAANLVAIAKAVAEGAR